MFEKLTSCAAEVSVPGAGSLPNRPNQAGAQVRRSRKRKQWNKIRPVVAYGYSVQMMYARMSERSGKQPG